MNKELLYKCIDFRKSILKSDSPKHEIEKLTPDMLIALLVGISITSIEELQIN